MVMKISKPKLIGFFLIFFILFIALLLRIQQWFHFLGHDEIFTMQWIWTFHQDPFPVHHYAPFFLYINYFLSLIYKTVLGFLGVINFDSSFFTSDFGFIFTLKAGRILTAIFGVILVYFVYRIGDRYFNREVALASALIMAVSRPLVIDSHNFKTDIFVSLLLTVVLYFLLQYILTGEPRSVLLAAFFLGLSIAAKYNAVLMVPVMVISFFLKKQFFGKKVFKRNIMFIILGGFGGFLLGAPNWIVHPIENFKAAAAYLKGVSAELVWYDPMPSSYILYSKNILESFGIILTILFVVGLIFSFIKKDKLGIITSLYVLIYFLFIGRANYLNHRAILPIFSGIALIIGKAMFSDIKSGLQKLGKVKSLFSPLAWIVVIVITSQQFFVNLESFNLLKTISAHPVREYRGLGLPDYSWFFMKNHIDSRFSFFREMWTPPVSGYKGSAFGRDIIQPSLKKFKGPDAFHFLITSFRTNYILTRSHNPLIKKAAYKRLEDYSPFYKVYRPRIFTWNDDITFWYRKSEYVKAGLNPNPAVKLPRLFYNDDKNTTIYLPLQFYEKNPNFGKTINRRFCKRFFSKQEILKMRFIFLNPGIPSLIKININNIQKKVTLKKDSQINEILIDNIQPDVYRGMPIRRLQEITLDKKAESTSHYLYKLEVESNHNNPCFFVFFPIYGGKEKGIKKPFIFPEKIMEDIPHLFESDQFPVWIKSFYRQTGVDLELLLFMNKNTLYKNPGLSISDPYTDYFPLEPGDYVININGSKIIERYPISNNVKIQIDIISEGASKRRTIKLDENFVRSHKKILIKTYAEISFVKLQSEGCRNSNFLIQKIILTPDYRTYINDNILLKKLND